MKDYEELPQGMVDRFWTVPNVITMIRILMLIPLVYCFYVNTPASYTTAFFLILFAYLTDMLDGMVARMTKQVSKVGMMLDPLSDKLMAITLSATLLLKGKLPFYFFLLVVLRETLIVVGAVYAMSLKKVIVLPNVWGKVYTLIFGVVISLYPLRHSSLIVNAGQRAEMITDGLVQYGTYIAVLFLLLSMVIYTVRFIKQFMVAREES